MWGAYLFGMVRQEFRNVDGVDAFSVHGPARWPLSSAPKNRLAWGDFLGMRNKNQNTCRHMHQNGAY
jgi:hypothetical protein